MTGRQVRSGLGQERTSVESLLRFLEQALADPPSVQEAYFFLNLA